MIYLNGKTEFDYRANFIHKEISSPEPKRTTVSIPLTDGEIDTSAILSPIPFFETREIQIGLELRSHRWEWPIYWSQLFEDLHGQTVKVELPDDPDYYWTGVASVGEIEDHGMTAGVTITVAAHPFKRSRVAEPLFNGTLSGDETLEIFVTAMRGYPEFDAGAPGMTVEYDGETWTLPVGESTCFGLVLPHGDSTLTLHGSGSLTVKYREGAL